jgi:hypothetical protein
MELSGFGVCFGFSLRFWPRLLFPDSDRKTDVVWCHKPTSRELISIIMEMNLPLNNISIRLEI